jgi:hypothetical protein
MSTLAAAAAHAAETMALAAITIRKAHTEACRIDGDGLELLLREAIADAVKLQQRMQSIADFAASPRYSQA